MLCFRCRRLAAVAVRKLPTALARPARPLSTGLTSTSRFLPAASHAAAPRQAFTHRYSTEAAASPSAGDRPAAEEHQPAAEESQPASEEPQPAPEEAQSAPEEPQPAPGEPQPAPEEPQPAPEKPDYFNEAESAVWDKLVAEFCPTELMVQDISGGCGSMYGIEIASDKFRGLSSLKQQRLVNAVLGDKIKEWHGLQLRTKVPSDLKQAGGPRRQGRGLQGKR
ncbi:bola-like protein [Xylariaceae sp. FL0804]|nr:bola-like protein [Xylariaceae sp. FL0804]